MTENATSLADFYKGWDIYQQHLLITIAPLTADQLALRAAPHMWSIGMTATHIIAARVGWFHMLMGEGSSDLAPMADWDEKGEPIRSTIELITGLEATWHMIQDALALWTVADLEQPFKNPYWHDPENEGRHSRQWILWHVLEHDLHHGGELSLALGIHGLTGIDL